MAGVCCRGRGRVAARYSHGMNTLADNLQTVRDRIAQACTRCQRDPHSVQLLAVSKTFPAEAVQRVAHMGQRDFGENYIQEAVEKITQLRRTASSPALVWHCIGPIQSNKTRAVAEHFDWAHTVDRLKIVQRLNEQRPPELPPLQVCIQVNTDGGATKSGVAPDEALALAREIAAMPRLRLRGLMTIPDPVEGFDAQLALHRQARELFETLREALCLPQFDTLSMGMSADLEAAVQAGSTMVRVGSAIFGSRPVKVAG